MEELDEFFEEYEAYDEDSSPNEDNVITSSCRRRDQRVDDNVRIVDDSQVTFTMESYPNLDGLDLNGNHFLHRL